MFKCILRHHSALLCATTLKVAVTVLINALLIKTWIVYIPTLAPPTFLANKISVEYVIFISHPADIKSFNVYTHEDDAIMHYVTECIIASSECATLKTKCQLGGF